MLTFVDSKHGLTKGEIALSFSVHQLAYTVQIYPALFLDQPLLSYLEAMSLSASTLL